MKFMDVQTEKGIISMSKIVMGTDYFGVNIPEDTAFALLDKYIALGGNTIDTARVYGKAPAPDPDEAYANSEPIVGRWLTSRGCRDKIFLVTKGAHPSMKDMNCRRLDRASIDSDVAMSLHELNTDYIDLYFLHRDDPSRPVEEIIDTLDPTGQSAGSMKRMPMPKPMGKPRLQLHRSIGVPPRSHRAFGMIRPYR